MLWSRVHGTSVVRRRRVGFSDQMCGVVDSVSPDCACLICDRALSSAHIPLSLTLSLSDLSSRSSHLSRNPRFTKHTASNTVRTTTVQLHHTLLSCLKTLLWVDCWTAVQQCGCQARLLDAATPLSATDKPAERMSRVAKRADLLMWPWRLDCCACAFTRCHYKLVKLSRLPPLLHRWDLVSVSTPLCLLKSKPCSLQAPQLPFVFRVARRPWNRIGKGRRYGTLLMRVNTQLSKPMSSTF